MKKFFITIAMFGAGIACAFADDAPTLFKHRPLFEEYTGTWCGWCTRGYIALELLAEKYPHDLVQISYHVNDGLSVTSTFPMSFLGVPTSSIDRMDLIDPYYGSTSNVDFHIEEELKEAMARDAIAGIELTGEISGKKVTVNSRVEFATDIEQNYYVIGYVLIADGLSSNSWAQSNDYYKYRDNGILDGTPLEPLTKWGATVRGLVYNDVAIDASAMRGIMGSLPESVKAGEVYEHSYTFDIANNVYAGVPENLKVAAFVLGRSNRKVVNANLITFIEADVESLPADEATLVVSTEYFNLSGSRVVNPDRGVFIVVETLADGTVRSRKVVK